MAHVDNLRRYFPALHHATYLNTGSFGLLPEVSVQAMKEAAEWQFREGRRRETYGAEITRVQELIRRELADLFDGREGNFALTESTTHGLNIVLSGFPFQPGDEILLTDLEHPAALATAFAQKRRGVVVRVVSIRGGNRNIVEAIQSGLTDRTRLVMVPHVSYVNGARFPLDSIIDLAHTHGALVLVDGAQGAGVEPVSMAELKCDFYVFAGHKWLHGPDATGALYVQEHHLTFLDPVYVGAAGWLDRNAYARGGEFLPHSDARRFEITSANLVSWKGWYESLRFMRVTVGWEYAHSRIQGLTRQVFDELMDVSGVEVVTERDQRGGLVHVRVPGKDLRELVHELSNREIVARYEPRLECVRVSPGFYNSPDEVSRFTTALRNLI